MTGRSCGRWTRGADRRRRVRDRRARAPGPTTARRSRPRAEGARRARPRLGRRRRASRPTVPTARSFSGPPTREPLPSASAAARRARIELTAQGAELGDGARPCRGRAHGRPARALVDGRASYASAIATGSAGRNRAGARSGWRRSSTTSARSRCPTTSCASASPLTDKEWEAIKRTPPSGRRDRRPYPGAGGDRRRGSATRTSASTAPATRTGSTVTRSRSPAAMLHVADAFDAMISGRPYGVPLPLDSALRELRQRGGPPVRRDCVDALSAHLGRASWRRRAGGRPVRLDRAALQALDAARVRLEPSFRRAPSRAPPRA